MYQVGYDYEKNAEKETEFGPRIERSHAWKTFETIFRCFFSSPTASWRPRSSFSHASRSGENKNPSRK
jgi:hypothetical protein